MNEHDNIESIKPTELKTQINVDSKILSDKFFDSELYAIDCIINESVEKMKERIKFEKKIKKQTTNYRKNINLLFDKYDKMDKKDFLNEENKIIKKYNKSIDPEYKKYKFIIDKIENKYKKIIANIDLKQKYLLSQKAFD